MIIECGTADINVHVEGSGPDVMLLMGAGSPGDVWRAYQVPALVAAGYRTIAPDSRGVGGSSSEFPAPPETMAGDAAHILRQIADGPVLVVGTSMGARVAVELAAREPDLVAGMVLMAAQSSAGTVAQMYLRAHAALTGDVVPGSESLRVLLGCAGLSPRTLEDPVSARNWADLFSCQPWPPPTGVVEQFRVAASVPGPDPDMLGRCTVPGTVVSFADDIIAPPGAVREFADLLPRVDVVTVEAAGHLGYLEQPEETNRIILAAARRYLA
ncbi:alpha/beta fold hydrolase [Corynebacterium pygosceleis]|nr:alpha/beta hydrolase [Corynebacterium pygosceleis]